MPKFKIYTLSLLLFFSLPSLMAMPQNEQSSDDNISYSKRRKADYFYYEGLKLKNAGKYDAAFDAFNYSLSIDSVAAPVLYELSAFYMQLERPEKAVNMLRKAIESDPDNYTYKQALASCLRELGMFSEAAAEYQKLVETYPDKLELNYFLAEAFIQQGELKKAIDALNALEENMGMSEALSIQKYKLYTQLRDQKNAFAEIEKLADKFPTVARYQLLIGDLYLEKGDTEKALNAYDKAHAIDPGDPRYIVSMANFYEVTGDKEKAKKEIHTALLNAELDPQIKAGILSRYIQDLQQSGGDIKQIDEMFDTLLEQHPEDPTLKLMYGNYLLTQERTEDALAQFQLVTEIAPNNETAWQQLLSLYLTKEDIPNILAICKKCTELFPDSPEYYFYMGIAYFQQEEFGLSLKAYQDGLKIIPSENLVMKSNFYGQIGDIYFQIEEPDSAFLAYDEALKYNAQNVPVLNNYSYYLTLKKKDLKKAERMSALCVRLEPNNATYLDTYAWVFFMQGNYTLAKMYIRSAINHDKTDNAELRDHYGDILYMSGEKDAAVEQWIKAKELGKESSVLDRKIAEKKYIEENL